MSDPELDDLLDRLVGEYCDALGAGQGPDPRIYLEQVPAHARPGLERCLKMIDVSSEPGAGALAPLVPGERLGRYVLLREVGRGGMAVVWLARDEELRRQVALKLLRPGLALEERHVERFRREGLAIAKLRHPNVVEIYDVGSERGYHYLAMEFVDGPSLEHVLEALGDRPHWRAEALAQALGVPMDTKLQTLEQALARLLTPVAAALQAAHDHGLVHRDVKPSNILLRRDGTPVVADFGLAKGDGDPALSLTGDPLGTPYYMSPEQAWLTEVEVDHRTDIYSLGVTLFEALAGERPFEGQSLLEVFQAIKTSLPPSLRGLEARVSKDAVAVCRKAMAHSREDRYGSAAEFQADLEALAVSAPTEARREGGSGLRYALNLLRMAFTGMPFEYKSRRTFLGLPLVHYYSGHRYPGQKMRVAKGWLACGEIAIGGIATGGIALGGLTFGGISAGLVSFGGISLALLLACGGLSAAFVANGGIAVGYLAIGGLAFGYGVIGGFARGVYAAGGNAKGRYTITDELTDLTWDEWWEGVIGNLIRVFS